MAIVIADIFGVVGAGLAIAKTRETQHTATVAGLQDYVDSFTAESVEQRRAIETAYEISQRSANACSSLVSSIAESVKTFMIETMVAEDESVDRDDLTISSRWIDEFVAQSDTFDLSAIGSSLAYGGSNIGNGAMLVSTKLDNGKVAEFCFAEDVVFTASEIFGTAITFQGAADRSADSPLSPTFPSGSGSQLTVLSDYVQFSDNLVANGNFTDTDDTYSIHRPTSWNVITATLGTTLKVTTVEIQTVVFSGSPTSGYFLLRFTDLNSKVSVTEPIEFDATATTVQLALRAIVGLEEVEVVRSGAAPNYTYTITFYGVPNPAQLTSENFFDTGNIAHNTTTSGSANVVRSDRALEFDSNGVELTTVQQLVTADALTTYAVSLLAKVDSVPAAGVITVDLVDGIGGSVVADDEGTNNSFTITCSALSNSAHQVHGAMFRTPTNLPGLLYLRIRITTAVSNTSSVFINQVRMQPATRLYAGGPYVAIIPNSTNWVVGDTITLTVTNDRAGELHEWMNRIFSLRENDLVFPIDSPGTVPDSVIA